MRKSGGKSKNEFESKHLRVVPLMDHDSGARQAGWSIISKLTSQKWG